MKAKNLDNAAEFNPYTAMTEGGYSPAQIKEFIVSILEDYIVDKDFLKLNATSLFAAEAIRIGRLRSNAQWKRLFEYVLSVREKVIREKPEVAFEIYREFQSTIDESERQFQLILSFERRKLDLDIEDFTFEILRNIGSLVEAVLQPFLREFCALLQANAHSSVDLNRLHRADLGNIVSMIFEHLPDEKLLAPPPHNIKLNQWRNIAQHHSYTTSEETIYMRYGKLPNIKTIETTRDQLFDAARELMYRVSIFKGSREISLVNYRTLFRPLVSLANTSISDRATLIAAAIATQGFRLEGLSDNGVIVAANIVDVADNFGDHRQIHCSQFALLIGQWFQGKNIEIIFQGKGIAERWRFMIESADVYELLRRDDPYDQLIEKLKIEIVKNI